jgi:hypothetical protein
MNITGRVVFVERTSSRTNGRRSIPMENKLPSRELIKEIDDTYCLPKSVQEILQAYVDGRLVEVGKVQEKEEK